MVDPAIRGTGFDVNYTLYSLSVYATTAFVMSPMTNWTARFLIQFTSMDFDAAGPAQF